MDLPIDLCNNGNHGLDGGISDYKDECLVIVNSLS